MTRAEAAEILKTLANGNLDWLSQGERHALRKLLDERAAVEEIAREFRRREATCREMREDMTYDKHALIEDKARVRAKAETWAAAAGELELIFQAKAKRNEP